MKNKKEAAAEQKKIQIIIAKCEYRAAKRKK
jgi:hypothetical protein